MDAHVNCWMLRAVHGAAMVASHPTYRDSAWCTVDALRTALGIHRISAFHYLQKHGRRYQRGASWHCIVNAYREAANDHGFEVTYLGAHRAKREYGRTIVTASRALLPHERVVFSVRGHVLGYHNKQTNDWADGRRHHIDGLWRFKQAA